MGLKTIIAAAAALSGAMSAASYARAADTLVAPTMTCSSLVGLQLGPGATVTKAEAVAAGPFKANPAAAEVMLPARCAVRGMIDARKGADGKAYGIEFAVNLPDQWNGRFLYQGGGGLNGVVNPPLGADGAGDRPALARGFAVASSDSGHKGAGFDRSFMADQVATLDFTYASVGRTAPVAKALIARYYARPAFRAYFAGCSTGGREGMIVTQRYPMDFDGVIAGDPAARAGHSNLALAYAAVAFNQVAARDPATGKPVPGTALSAADKALVIKGILDACDGDDGLKDGMIFNPAACRFDPVRLRCAGAKADGCLSDGQVAAIRKAFAGPKSASGRAIYSAFPYDTGVAVETGPLPGFLPSARPSPLGPPNLDMTMDVEAREAAVNADGFQRMQDSFWYANLGGFFGHGGKLMMFHGLSDPWFSPLDSTNYFDRLAQDPAASASSRLYLVPGMGHCRSGPTLDRFDMLSALVDWVENGHAPERIVATGPAFPGRSRPLCPYPAYAQYRGERDPENEASFECRRAAR